MLEGGSLLDFATLMTIWILGLQYFFNFFARKRLIDRYHVHKMLVHHEAEAKVGRVEEKVRIAIVGGLGLAAVLGTIGWITS